MPTQMTLFAEGKPSKEFFIDMLTRDIDLTSCVLDLLDNSVHSLVRHTGMDIMKTLTARKPQKPAKKGRVEISLSKSRFSILDNCGGVTLEDAQDELLRMGYPKTTPKVTGLGLYGIGMKRAFFKIGKQIDFQSRSNGQGFRVPINVDVWRKKPDDWRFKIEPLPAEDAPKSGHTKIQISGLKKGVGERFASPDFTKELVRKIGATYALFLKNGVQVQVNGTAVTPLLPTIATKTFTASRKRFKQDGVDVLIIAGTTEGADKVPRGWYIFCNGRMVIEADKTSLTGWGDNLPAFHSKYNHFVGYAYFRSKDLAALPWTTTKRGINTDSPIYQRALAEMRVEARPILNFLNKLYPSDLEAEGVPERQVLKDARPVTLDKLPKTRASFKSKPRKTKKETCVNVLLKRPRAEIDKIRNALGKPQLAAKRAVLHCIKYFLDKEC